MMITITITSPLLLLLLLLPSTTSATTIIPLNYLPTTCHASCVLSLSFLSFLPNTQSTNLTSSPCTSTSYLYSLYTCLSTYCTPTQLVVGWDSLVLACHHHHQQYDNPEEEQEMIIPSVKEMKRLVPDKEGLKVVDIFSNSNEDVRDGRRIWAKPILLNPRSFQAGWKTERAWQTQLMLDHLFGSTAYIFLLILIIPRLIIRLILLVRSILHLSIRGNGGPNPRTHTHTRTRTRTRTRTPHSSPSLSTRLKTMRTKYLFLPLTSAPSWIWTTSSTTSRIKTGLIGSYVLITLGLCGVGYETFEENLYWRNDRMGQLLRYLADRSGIMAIWHLPLLWLTATRNDLLIYLTGWSYAEFNILHRWIGRTVTALSVVHGGVYMWIARERLWRNLQKEYWYCGCIAGMAMLLLLPGSMQRFRERSYEVFLVVHIALAMICLATMFYHVKIFDGAYSPWLWTCVAIWAAERLIRLVRLVLFSWKGLDWSTLNAIAIVEDIEHEHLLRLTVSTALSYTPKAGTYYFLYFPTVFSPFENHPFTLSGWSRRSDGRVDLHFLIKEQQGVTRKLVRRTRREGNNRLQLKVWLEGPYGRAAPLQDYGHLLMVAGGSGIASCLPHIQQIRTLHSEGRVPVPSTSIRLLWIVRTQAYARRILHSNLRHDLPASLSLELDIYVTGAESTEASPLLAISTTEHSYGSDSSSGSLHGLKRERSDHRDLPNPVGLTVTYHLGRPRMADALNASLAEVQYTDQRLGIQTCGPAGMMQDLRAALIERYGVGKGDVWAGEVDFWEDGFVW